MVLLLASFVFPFLLLGLLVAMERVERPLRDDPMLDLAAFLENARPDEVEAFVEEGFAPALDRYWNRKGRKRPT